VRRRLASRACPIHKTTSGLRAAIWALRDGLAPSALSGEAIALVKDSGLSILKSLADSTRANPVVPTENQIRQYS
jgi:hypothetical protein